MRVLRFIIFFSFVSCIFFGCANLLCDNEAASACSLEAITITPSTASISKGLVQPFIATGTYKDGSTKPINDEVEWSSSNTEIATVNESGLVSTKDFGTSIIIAALGGISDSAVLTVTSVVLVTIEIDPLSLTLESGQTKQLTAIGTYSDSSNKDITNEVQWSSSDTGVATINENGIVTSVSSGTTTISAVSSSINSTSVVSVTCSISSSADDDGDRLPNCAETNTGVYVSATNTGSDPSKADTDGDGIDDGDEVLGTTAGLELHLMGTNPLRKDLLIEYDWFDDSLECSTHSHKPSTVALSLISFAFSSSPVTNPDGSTGINVIHDYGQGGQFTGGNLISDDNGVLSGGVNGSEFQSHKTNNFDSIRHGYFYYTLLPHRYNTVSSSSGQAELPGDDMIVSLYCYGSDTNVAHTVVHELGHNLGLRHGGFENTNWKPNYNSVMNYKYQFPGVDNNCTPPGDGVLSYSSGDRLDLDETDLDETEGICSSNLSPAWDWNDDSDTVDVNLKSDINVDSSNNGDGLFQVLRDHDDWSAVSFEGLANADGYMLALNEFVQEIVSCENPFFPSQKD